MHVYLRRDLIKVVVNVQLLKQKCYSLLLSSLVMAGWEENVASVSSVDH